MQRPEPFVILALPAAQDLRGRRKISKLPTPPPKRQKSKLPSPEKSPAATPEEWAEIEHRLHQNCVTPSATYKPADHQVPWLVPSSAGGGQSSAMAAAPSAVGVLEKRNRIPKNVSGKRAAATVTCIVPHTSQMTRIPSSSLTEDAVAPVMMQARSILAVVANYVDSSTSAGKKRHRPNEKNKCCLCHSDEDDDRSPIHTLEEYRSCVRKDVAEILRPIAAEMTAVRSSVQKSQDAWRQPQALQMVSGDVIIPKEEVFTGDESRQLQIIPQNYQWPSAAATDRENIPLAFSQALKEKSQEVDNLNSTVQDLVNYQQKLTSELEKSQRQLCRVVQGQGRSFPDGRPTLYLGLLEQTLKNSLLAIEHFTGHFVAYSAAKSHVPADKIWKPNFQKTHLAKDHHWTYALQAFFAEKMFTGFENDSFMTDAATMFLDPAQLRTESYAYFKAWDGKETQAGEALKNDKWFRKFCEDKFENIAPGDVLLEEDDVVAANEKNPFTQEDINLSSSFRIVAIRVWLLHKLCLSFDPAVTIFRARRGHTVDWKYMESVVRMEDDKLFIAKVGFMIAPGFRLRNSTVKSKIYLAARAIIPEVGIHGYQGETEAFGSNVQKMSQA